MYSLLSLFVIVGMKGLDKDIGLRAASEDIKEPEDKYVLVKASRLLGRGGDLIIVNRWHCSRSNLSSANIVEA